MTDTTLKPVTQEMLRTCTPCRATSEMAADALDAKDALIAELTEALDYALRAFDICAKRPDREVFLIVKRGSDITSLSDARTALAKARGE